MFPTDGLKTLILKCLARAEAEIKTNPGSRHPTRYSIAAEASVWLHGELEKVVAELLQDPALLRFKDGKSGEIELTDLGREFLQQNSPA